MKHGDTRVSKASPINWLRHFLEKHTPACSGEYVFMDQGGEPCNNPEVASSSLDLDRTLDLQVLMPPIKMLLWSAAM